MCEENPQQFLSAELQKLKRLGWRVSNLPLKTTWLFPGTLVRTGIPFPIHSTTRATALKVNVDISIFVVRIWHWNATITRNNSQYSHSATVFPAQIPGVRPSFLLSSAHGSGLSRGSNISERLTQLDVLIRLLTVKQATKRCHFFCNIAAKRVGKRCYVTPTLKPILQQIRLLQVAKICCRT